MLIDKFGFKTYMHENCMYYKTDQDNNLTLIARQVDNLKVPNKEPAECNQLAETIQKWLSFPLIFLGTIQQFNSINVDQTCHHFIYI